MDWKTAYLNILYNRGNIIQNLRNALKINDGKDYNRIISLCINKPGFMEMMNYSSFYSKEFGDIICSVFNLSKLSTVKIALIFSVLANIESNRINSFLVLKNEYDKDILYGRFSDAYSVLNKVFNEFGISIWLLDNVTLLYSLNNELFGTEDQLSSLLNHDMASLFQNKNRINIQHNYYLKQMEDVFDGSKSIIVNDYYKYILYVSPPSDASSWKNIFLMSTFFSFIDIYLCLVDYLQTLNSKNTKNVYYKELFKDNICSIENERIRISLDFNNPEHLKTLIGNEQNELLISFEKSDYDGVINHYYDYNNDSFCCTSFFHYLIVSLSYLFSEKKPQSNTNIISTIIIELMYDILKKDESSFLNSVYRLASIARLLRNFSIHKGISIFLNTVANYNYEYNYDEIFSSYADINYNFLESQNIITSLIPFTGKHKTLQEHTIEEFIEKYERHRIKDYNDYSKFYFQDGYVSFIFDRLINNNKVEEAIQLLVNSFLQNKLLVFDLNTRKIIDSISSKYSSHISLSIEELCYVFIDNNLLSIRDDVFLDLFDDYYELAPLDIIEQNDASELVKNFFLHNICTASMLSKVYILFLSGEDAENYRLKICDYLLNNPSFNNKKSILDEIEEITKKRMLSRKVKRINESKLQINEDYLRKKCFDEISELIDLFNNTPPFVFYFQGNDGVSYYKFENRRIEFLVEMYNIYCKEFCFGDSGLDISLSTRVRHGALKNNLLKIFSDNNLVFNGHGSNDYFDILIQDGILEKNSTILFRKFFEQITENLDYFVKNTLKVFIDTPIKGAVFDYNYHTNDFNEIFADLYLSKTVSYDEVIMHIHHFLIERTNKYLEMIRIKKINALEMCLINELDTLSLQIKDYTLQKNYSKELERRIVTCKTDIQNELENIKGWFTLSDFNEWDNFTFEELLETCSEIDKKLFSGFEKVNIAIDSKSNSHLKGFCFREIVDIVLIIFNNAITHSGFLNSPEKLTILCELNEDTDNLYFIFKNNLDENVNLTDLDTIIAKVNNIYQSNEYLQLNIRQEGGMGLYKIMHILSSLLQQKDSFYISRKNNDFSVRIKLGKEICE